MEHHTQPAIATTLEFIDRINGHDVEGLAEMMTDDHEFIDSLGNSVAGREAMRLGWKSYFALCPDYWVVREETFVNGDRVVVVGHAGGTIAAAGELPAANRWRNLHPGWRLSTPERSNNGVCTPTTNRSTTY